MSVTIVTGGQFGDEAKGKVTAYLSLRDEVDMVARAGVGPNAGHTVQYRGKRYPLRLIPCGFVQERAQLLIGAGVLINPEVLLREIEITGVENRIKIDERCGIIERRHIEEDSKGFLKKEIGTTGSGCGPANAERVYRRLKLAKDLDDKRISRLLGDVPLILREGIEKGKEIMVEGSQGFGLSLLYGTYPYVTSKDTTASTFLADVGLGPKFVEEVIVVFKSYVSRVGEGPLKNEIPPERAEEMGIVEYGTVTGRRRRIGLFDFELAERAVLINGATQIAITNVDKLFPDAAGKDDYDRLPREAKRFIEDLEDRLRVPVTLISNGPDVEQMIDLRREKL